MEYMHTFESFLNEAVKPGNNIPDLEKALMKAADINEYLNTWLSYNRPWMSSINYQNLILSFVPKANMKDIILSQGQYAALEKKRYEAGYGDIDDAKPVVAKAAYDKLVQNEEWDRLIYKTIENSSIEAFIKKIAAYFKKNLSPLLLAQKILYFSYTSANDQYDRSLIMDKYFSKLGNAIWYDSNEVNNSKGRNAKESAFRDYLKKLENIVK